MRVKVQFFASLREFVGLEELNLEVSKDSTLIDLLGTLTKKFGPRFEEVRTKDPFEGYVRGESSSPAILVNGRPVDLEKSREIKLNDEDVVVIMPLVAGG